jgi:hypothetical protein
VCGKQISPAAALLLQMRCVSILSGCIASDARQSGCISIDTRLSGFPFTECAAALSARQKGAQSGWETGDAGPSAAEEGLRGIKSRARLESKKIPE